MNASTARVLAELERCGLLLEQDRKLPSVVTLVTGEAPKTSWWSHDRAHLVFAVLSELVDHEDVLFAKLVARKVTLVHRALWPALLAVASADEPWQRRDLSEEERELLSRVERAGEPVVASGPSVKALETRLLACATQVHTDSGRHATALETWDAWRRRVSVEPLRSASEGRRRLEQVTAAFGAPSSVLPWPAERRPS